jgi:UDP-N-acetylmuramoyl-tripeptide--D-alanyl-D-alanine ligase
VAAALDMLAASRPTDGIGRVARGRRIAILGDMLELGPTEAELHAALAVHPAMASIDRVHCVGPRARALWEALPPRTRGEHAETADAFAGRAHALVDAGDIVLVKGSLGIRLRAVVDALRKLGQAAPSEFDDQG